MLKQGVIMCYVQPKKIKQEMNYFGTRTVTVSAVFVKNINSFLLKNSQQLQNVLIINKQNDASKCVTVAKSSCALVAMIISKLKFKFLGLIITMEFKLF